MPRRSPQKAIAAAKPGQVRAAIYARVSTEEQAQEGYSLEGQVDRLKQFCLAKGMDVVGTYIDGGFTGRDTKRPEYTRMMLEIATWDVLVVMKMDRIHRNTRNFIDMMEKIGRAKKEFTSMQDNFDTSNVMGRFVMDLMQRLAQLESEQIGERTSFALRVKAKSGDQVLGQRAPWGYRWSEGSKKYGTGDWVVIPKEAAEVRRIFALAVKGQGRAAIAREIGWCDCKPKVKVYRHQKTDGTIVEYKYDYIGANCTGCYRVYYITRNPAYAGYFQYRGQVMKGKHEPLVPRETWVKAQGRRRIPLTLPP